MDKGYISMDQLQQRQAELLGQRQTLKAWSANARRCGSS